MPPKSLIGIYVSPEIAEKLRECATRVGAPLSDLSELLLRFGLERLPEDRLQEWAAKRPSTRGRLGGGLTKAQRGVLLAIEQLTTTGEGAFRFSAAEIASTAGLLRKEGYLALKACQARGMVKGFESEECDKWDRPLKSYWMLAKKDGAA